jgi:D-alanyl-D-alanine carboxypeptidase
MKRKAWATGWIATLVVCATLLASCGSSKGQSPSLDVELVAGREVNGSGDLSQEDEASSPGAPTFSPSTLEVLEKRLSDYLLFTGEPGISVTIRRTDGAVWHGAAGSKDLAADEPLSVDNRFRAGSNTKMFTAAIILQLVDEGVLSLEDTLGDMLGGYDDWDEVTLEQLLGMTGGIPDYLSLTAFFMDAFLGGYKTYAPADIIAFAQDAPMDFVPGQGCKYSSTNYLLLGLVMEEVTGKTAEQLYKDRIIEPLELKDTYLDVEGAQDDLLAHGYYDIALIALALGMPQAFLESLTADVLVKDKLADLTHVFHPSIAWTTGSVVSTPADMTVMVDALLGGVLFSAELVEQAKQMHSCELLGQQIQYGLGLMMFGTPVGDSYGHGGITYGYHTMTFQVPDAGLTYSRMHDFFPEQGSPLMSEMLQVLNADPFESNFSCDWSEETLNAGTTFNGDHVSFSMRGTVLDGDGTYENADSAMSRADAWLTGQRQPCHGLHAGIGLDTLMGEETLGFLSVGASYDSGADAKITVLSLGHKTLLSLTGTAGLQQVDLSAAEDVSLVLADGWFDATGEYLEMICAMGISQPVQEAMLEVCTDGAPVVPGATIGVNGVLGITTEAALVEAVLMPLWGTMCMCSTDGSDWAVCPD